MGVSDQFSSFQLLSHVRLFVTPWTVAHQAPPSMEFSRQEYWSGLPFPSPGNLPNSGFEPGSPALRADSLPSEPPGDRSTSRIMIKGSINNPIYSCSYLKETTSKPSPLSIIFAIFLLGTSYEIKKFPPINIATFL